MSDPNDRAIVVPEPPPASPWRRAIPIVGIAWVVLHLLIPLRYYAGGDEYDERFAWRMFSSVRVRQCRVEVTETREGARRPLPIMQVLPAPWFALLERNRPAVVARFLDWRCERAGTSEVRFHNECRDPTGAALPPIDLTMSCADRSIRDEGGE